MEVEKVQLVFVFAWPTFQERNFMIFPAKSCFLHFLPSPSSNMAWKCTWRMIKEWAVYSKPGAESSTRVWGKLYSDSESFRNIGVWFQVCRRMPYSGGVGGPCGLWWRQLWPLICARNARLWNHIVRAWFKPLNQRHLSLITWPDCSRNSSAALSFMLL